MPDDTLDAKPARTPKDEKRREQIMVGAGVAGVLLTVVLIKRSGSNAAQPPVSPPIGPNGAPSAGSYSSGVASSDFYDLEAQVQGLNSQLSAMSAAPVPVGTPSTPTASPTNISITLVDPHTTAQGMQGAQSVDAQVHGIVNPPSVAGLPAWPNPAPVATGVGTTYDVNGFPVTFG